MSPTTCDAFRADLHTVAADARHSVVASTRADRAHLFDSWVAFADSLGCDPYLRDVPPTYHLDFFIVYACQYCCGSLSHSAQPIGAQRVEEALHAMGQEFSRLGIPDPGLDGTSYVFRLKTLFKAWADNDQAPSRVWPINVTILRALVTCLSLEDNQPRAQAILDLCVIAFYFLC
jgi:hypothetical protein